MRISRIYTDLPLTPDTTVTLIGQTAHYLIKVLRLEQQAPLRLFNGDGFEYHGEILDLNKKQVIVTIKEQLNPAVESPLHTILGLGISRGERMDYAVQKSTELGVNTIVPLFTEHCEVKLKGERLQKRQAHWQQIAISATEQSGRTKVPDVLLPTSLSTWQEQLNCQTKLILDGSQSYFKALTTTQPPGEIALLIGPEGGFSENEITTALASGFIGLKLGPRVLRTETAPVAALTILQHLWGDLL